MQKIGSMGLIQNLFRLQASDGSTLAPSVPVTLSELVAAIEKSTMNVPDPKGGKATEEEFRAPFPSDDALDSAPRGAFDHDDELVFLPPPILRARVDVPLEVSLAPVVLGVPAHGEAQPRTGQGGGLPSAKLSIRDPRIASHSRSSPIADAGRIEIGYQPTVSLPWLY